MRSVVRFNVDEIFKDSLRIFGCLKGLQNLRGLFLIRKILLESLKNIIYKSQKYEE